MTVTTVFYIILLISGSLLCIALIVYLNRITRSVRQIESELKQIGEDVRPLITSSTQLAESLNEISEGAKSGVNLTKDIIVDVKDRVDSVLAFEEKIRRRVESPVLELIQNLSALVNGVNAFWNAFTKK
jgi:uncharacterized protein YoxC